jgi:hypothetical protein
VLKSNTRGCPSRANSPIQWNHLAGYNNTNVMYRLICNLNYHIQTGSILNVQFFPCMCSLPVYESQNQFPPQPL